MHMCRHTEKYIVLILTLLTLFGISHQCHVNVLISCVFLKDAIFPDRDGIRKIHTHDHRQAVHQERTEILNYIVQNTHQQHIRKVLFKDTKTALLQKMKNLLFSHVGSKSNQKVVTSENMQLALRCIYQRLLAIVSRTESFLLVYLGKFYQLEQYIYHYSLECK